MPLIDQHRPSGHAARSFRRDREFRILPRGPPRPDEFKIRQACREDRMGCRGGGHPLQIEPPADGAGQRHALDVKHLTRFRHKPVEVERPLHSR